MKFNLTLVGPGVSDKNMFKECGRRRTTDNDGRRMTTDDGDLPILLAQQRAVGSGELK